MYILWMAGILEKFGYVIIIKYLFNMENFNCIFCNLLVQRSQSVLE